MTQSTLKKPKLSVLLLLNIDVIGFCRLPAILHKAGCHVTLFCPRQLAARQSRFIDQHINAPIQLDAFTEALRQHLAQNPERYTWIQPGDEMVLRALAARSGEDWAAACLPVPRSDGYIKLITDKLSFLNAAHQVGLPVPAQAVCTNAGQLQAALQHIPFPLMVKRGESMSGSGVAFVDCAEHLVDSHCSPENPLMLQSYVEGLDCSSEVLFDHGHPIAWLSSYHREHWPNRWTSSCVRELAELPDVEHLLEQIGQLTQFHGLAGIDWLLAGNTLYLIELNPRPTPCYHLGQRVGVDFAQAIRAQRLGENPNIQRPQPPKPGKALVHLFPQYCYWAIDRRLWRHILRCQSDCLWRDPLLALAFIRRIISHYLPASLKITLKKMLGLARA